MQFKTTLQYSYSDHNFNAKDCVHSRQKSVDYCVVISWVKLVMDTWLGIFIFL